MREFGKGRESAHFLTIEPLAVWALSIISFGGSNHATLSLPVSHQLSVRKVIHTYLNGTVAPEMHHVVTGSPSSESPLLRVGVQTTA